MCNRAGLLVGWDYAEKRALFTRADCDSWRCPECAKRITSNWILRAQIGTHQLIDHGERVDFVTITSHEKLKTFEQTLHVWRDAWPVLYAVLKRKKPTLQYFLVPEKHEDGRLHFHALWNAGVKKRWLKDNARWRGFGYECDVSPVTTVLTATRYVTKYVGKSLGDDVPPRFRRVRVSNSWPELPVPESVTSQLEWHYLNGNGDLLTCIEKCQRDNIDMIELDTGEKFDAYDCDLGTIIAW